MLKKFMILIILSLPVIPLFSTEKAVDAATEAAVDAATKAAVDAATKAAVDAATKAAVDAATKAAVENTKVASEIAVKVAVEEKTKDIINAERSKKEVIRGLKIALPMYAIVLLLFVLLLRFYDR